MKRRKFLTRTIALGAIPFFINKLFAGPKDTDVYVIVDTANINNTNVNQMVQISDNQGGVHIPGRASSTTTHIDPDKWIVWEGQVKDPRNNPDDEVFITKIKKKEDGGGTSLLKKDEYTGKEVVKGKVNKDYISGDFAYDIHFTVVRNGVSKDYEVDPKLRMKPPVN